MKAVTMGPASCLCTTITFSADHWDQWNAPPLPERMNVQVVPEQIRKYEDLIFGFHKFSAMKLASSDIYARQNSITHMLTDSKDRRGTDTAKANSFLEDELIFTESF